MRVVTGLLHIAAFFAACALAGCGDELTRGLAEQILNGASRGHACNTDLQFIEGGLEKAKASGALTLLRNESGLLGTAYHASDVPGGGRWIVFHLGFETNPLLSRRPESKQCLPGHVEITSIADMPFAPGNNSYKVVEYIERVTIPPELARLKGLVFDGYRKSATFQKTDNGWRVAQ